MLFFNLVPGYINKDVNNLPRSKGLAALDSLGESKEGINYSTGNCERGFSFLLVSAFLQDFKIVGLFYTLTSNILPCFPL